MTETATLERSQVWDFCNSFAYFCENGEIEEVEQVRKIVVELASTN